MGTTISPTAQRLERFSRLAATLTAVIGVVVLAGWLLGIAALKSVLPGLVTMKANTAACFALSGISLLLFGVKQPAAGTWGSAVARFAALALAGLVATVGALTLSQDLWSLSAGIDQFLVRDAPGAVQTVHPGRMSPATASAFVFVGISLMLLMFEVELAIVTGQFFAAATLVVSSAALMGYLLGVGALYRVGPFSSIALHTSFAFLLLAGGLLSARPARGWMREFSADTSSARLARRLAAGALLLLPVLAVFRLEAERRGWFGTEFGLGVFTVTALTSFLGLLWLATRAANRGEEQIARLARIHAVLSAINALIVRSHDRQALLAESCRIAVHAGGYPFVWIGLVDREAMRVNPVAWAGEERGILEQARDRLSLRVEPEAAGPVASAVLNARPVTVDDVRVAPNMPFRRELLERGVRSFGAFPLIVAGEAVGVLVLYAATSQAFNDEEMKILGEMAGDIAYALDHIEKEERLNYLAYYNSLTRLANATLFRDRLAQHVAGAKRAKGNLALVLFDVEAFQRINSAFGRDVGDEVLRQIGSRLERGVEDPSRLARIDADRFAAIVPRLPNETGVAQAYEAIVTGCFAQPFDVGGEGLRLSARAGIAIFPQDGADADTLYKNAGSALAQAKAKAPGEPYQLYNVETGARIHEKLRLEARLRSAIEKDELLLHYQPKVDARSRQLTGIEALMRWRSPDFGLVPPVKFIPLMEETGFIVETGIWALRQAAADARRLAQTCPGATRIAINVSSVQLRRPDFVAAALQAVGGESASHLVDLEITESTAMLDIDATVSKLEALRRLGFGVSIDDFGTGHSSLAYLAKLPAQSLKIDRSFVAAMLGGPDAATLVLAIISLAHTLGLKVIAEGVESEAQAKFLSQTRCDEIQGYLVCKPVPFEELLAFAKRAAS